MKASDSGNYSCIVGNQFGIDIQWTLLQVKGSCLFFRLFVCFWSCFRPKRGAIDSVLNHYFFYLNLPLFDCFHIMLSLSVHHNNHKAFFKMFCRFSGHIILKWSIQFIILLIFHTLIINGNGKLKLIEFTWLELIYFLCFFLTESPLLLKQFAHLTSVKGSDIVFTCNVAKKSTHEVLCDLNDSCNY